MASLDQMKQAAASQGATAPAGYPGGADAWVKDWYQNAVNAGSVVDPTTPYTRGEATETDATTGATPQGRKNTGSSPFADMIRAKAKAEHWSEDFERFSDAQIDAWKPFYDEKTGKFHSENDPTGAATYDKPAECPPGTTFHGSKCVGWDQLPPELGGTLGMPKGTQPAGAKGTSTPGAPDYYNPDDPLQARLMELMQSGGGAFGGINAGAFTQGGGAMWSTPTPGGAAAPAAPTAAAAIPPVTPTGPGNAALMSATLNAFTPNAPSGGGGGGTNSAAVESQSSSQPAANAPTPQPAPVYPPPPPRQPVGKMLTDPNDWWKSPRTA